MHCSNNLLSRESSCSTDVRMPTLQVPRLTSLILVYWHIHTVKKTLTQPRAQHYARTQNKMSCAYVKRHVDWAPGHGWGTTRESVCARLFLFARWCLLSYVRMSHTSLSSCALLVLPGISLISDFNKTSLTRLFTDWLQHRTFRANKWGGSFPGRLCGVMERVGGEERFRY